MTTGTMQHVTILGTGLIGASIGLALHANGFSGRITGWDRNPAESKVAQENGAIDDVAEDPIAASKASDLILLATPVFGILDWMQQLAPVLQPGQLVTDVGSTKRQICEQAVKFFNRDTTAGFLAGHPMAGKEVYGAAHADAQLFRGAVWLFSAAQEKTARPVTQFSILEAERKQEWRAWVLRFGTRIVDVDPARHDELCAWASHLPQMLGTALAALLEEEFGASEELREELRDVGGRAMREMTRLGASPFSMWRDVAQTNTEPIAATLLALEQRLAHLRENLKQPELRDEFDRANQFRRRF
ncbi:MAG TPA: prephenate dehydrogenase [Acidobacteriaceae bacterium]|nr:prephenate dehydrogenase [Acidobacteriaceae bacterium]